MGFAAIRAARAMASPDTDTLDLDAALSKLEKAESGAKTVEAVHTQPRRTVKQMLLFAAENPEVVFSFKTRRYGGDQYLAAMRMVLSRTRRAATKHKLALEPRKMLRVLVEQQGDCDVVQVLWTQHKSLVQKGVYEELAEILSQEK